MVLNVIEEQPNFFRINILDPKHFSPFKNIDAGFEGRVLKTLGYSRRTGTWYVTSYLISKKDVSYTNDKLVPKNPKGRIALTNISTKHSKVRRFTNLGL